MKLSEQANCVMKLELNIVPDSSSVYCPRYTSLAFANMASFANIVLLVA